MPTSGRRIHTLRSLARESGSLFVRALYISVDLLVTVYVLAFLCVDSVCEHAFPSECFQLTVSVSVRGACVYADVDVFHMCI